MNEREYNEAEGIRRSDLWKMEDSPEKFKWFMDHPAEQTPALTFGSAAHKIVLEGKDFSEEYAVAPDVDRRKKEGKEIWAQFVEDNPGKTVISNSDYETISVMAAAIGNCPLAKKLLTGKGITEEPFFWTDPETGEKCKINWTGW
jgi:exodeoxyribonuclease VIII